jgi:hypothetical protein
MPISYFTGSWCQQKSWIRCWVISARRCSRAIHFSAARVLRGHRVLFGELRQSCRDLRVLVHFRDRRISASPRR